jgi:hypothetical protein
MPKIQEHEFQNNSRTNPPCPGVQTFDQAKANYKQIE